MGGEGIEEDRAKACYWFMQAAQQGVPDAMYWVSLMLINGDGVEKDEKYGIRFLEAAAQKGIAEAQYDMGIMYIEGKYGSSVDVPTACYWMSQAADKGHVKASSELGWRFCYGNEVKLDRRRGLELLEFAASQGDKNAIKGW